MTVEEYKEFVDYIVAIPEGKPELSSILEAQQQFIDESDTNVLQELLLNAPVIKRLIAEARITEEQLQWLGLAACSILLIGYAWDKCAEYT